MSRAAALERPSWGRYPRQAAAAIVPQWWRHDALPEGASLLARGCGRSYGDSCLNDQGTLIDTGPLDHAIAFDRAGGILRAESGMTLGQVLELVVGAGWFLPVTPGTRFVSLGGALANDVHGKNHHRAATFGCHVRRFELLRSDGARIECSAQENAAMFAATIGGLGLTGLVTWVEIQLRPIRSALLEVDTVKFANIAEYLALARAALDRHEYVVAWVDATARGKGLGRGLFMAADHVDEPGKLATARHGARLAVPFDFPEFVLSHATIATFNVVYRASARAGRARGHYEPFFYPLDAVRGWNRMYGARGFLQHQCVVPGLDDPSVLEALLREIAAEGDASFLTVLKVFGARRSPGMLSFPRPGITLALDFPVRGRTFALLERLDAIVMEAGGAVYPAKDARMSPRTFARSFPRVGEFERHVDPRFSSSFWRRVRAHG